jgi:hypothetical protein
MPDELFLAGRLAGPGGLEEAIDIRQGFVTDQVPSP